MKIVYTAMWNQDCKKRFKKCGKYKYSQWMKRSLIIDSSNR